MSSKVVKYHNDLNYVSMRQWSAEEMDLFFTIIAKIRDKGTSQQVLNAEELKILTGSETRNSYWFKMLDEFTDKAINLVYKEHNENSFKKMTMFTLFEYFSDSKCLAIEVSSRFEYIVNKLTANFTVYELAEFTSLKSTYSKTMYRILKQWRTIGKKEFKIDQFRGLLDIPDSYNVSAINRQVLKPIKKELSEYFKGLKIKVLKKNTQGTPVIGYLFTWKPEKTGEWIPGKFEKKEKEEERKESSGEDAISAYLENKMLEDFKASQKALLEDQIDIDDL